MGIMLPVMWRGLKTRGNMERTAIRPVEYSIEEAEIQALRGAGETLAKTDRLVVERFWHEQEIADLLTKSGFALTRLSFGHHLPTRAPGG